MTKPEPLKGKLDMRIAVDRDVAKKIRSAVEWAKMKILNCGYRTEVNKSTIHSFSDVPCKEVLQIIEEAFEDVMK